MNLHNITNFTLKENKGYYESVSLDQIINKIGTPTYIYSATGIKETIKKFIDATSHGAVKYKYAVKANTNIEIIKLINKCGFGADVVSIGEVYAALKAGVANTDIVFAGMGKSISELKEALTLNIGYISIESVWEYEQLQKIATNISSSTKIIVRVNLNIDGSTHPYLTTGREENKFGIDSERVINSYTQWQKESKLAIDGIQVHIGSQILDVSAFREAASATINFVSTIRNSGGIIDIVDFGGGVGVSYDDGEDISLNEYGLIIKELQEKLNATIFLEPGRYIVSTNGILCGSVIYYKHGITKDFLVADIGMNDIIRPALYDAYHKIIPCYKGKRELSQKKVDIVGPICESGDFVGLSRSFPILESGDLIVMATVGAYGFTMASNYNLRSKPMEVLVEGNEYKLIRKKQNLDEYM